MKKHEVEKVCDTHIAKYIAGEITEGELWRDVFNACAEECIRRCIAEATDKIPAELCEITVEGFKK